MSRTDRKLTFISFIEQFFGKVHLFCFVGTIFILMKIKIYVIHNQFVFDEV